MILVKMTLQQTLNLKEILNVAHHDYERGLTVRAFFKLQDQAMSEDLVQDTFTKAWTYLAKGGEILLMKAFLYHILNDLIIDEYRKHKTVSLDTLLEKGFEPSIDPSVSLFNILDGKAALLLIQRLPKTYRRVMHMRYIQDLSIKEMSLITGQSKNTITVQAHRGLVLLKLLKSPSLRLASPYFNSPI
jgi:RNA polymerase sigma-70 factor (ECF subfamily)